MDTINPDQVINGVDGEVWCDNAKLAECSEFEATVGISYTDILKEHNLFPGKKMTALNGTGKMHLYHISDEIAKKVVENIKARKCPVFLLKGKVDDPDGIGPSTITIYDAKVDGIPILQWSRSAVGEYDINYTFSEFDFEPNV